MASRQLAQVWYPQQHGDLKDNALLGAWMNALVTQGYYFWDTSENISQDDWSEAFQHQTILPGISPVVQSNITNFVADHQRQDFSCNVSFLHEELSFTIGISTEMPALVYSIDSSYFTFLPTGEQKYALWLAITLATCGTFHPAYSFLVEPDENFPDVTYAEIQQKSISKLFALNVFGPELAERIGRSRLLSAPAWYLREASDGSIILAPTPMIDPSGALPYTMEAVGRHLGLSI